MSRLGDLVRANRWTSAMLCFVALLYSFLLIFGMIVKEDHPSRLHREDAFTAEEMKQKEDTVKQKLTEHPEVAGAVTLAFIALITGGILLDMILMNRRLRGMPWIVRQADAPAPKWGRKQMLQALVFLFFSEGCIFLMHLLGTWLTGTAMPEDVFLMVSSLLRDLATALFVIFLIRRGGGTPFADLGMTRDKLFSHIRLGILAYVAMVPVLILSFTLLAVLASLFSYEPAPQNVVQMYLKPDAAPYLLWFTVFVAGMGPVLEEMFFRGFLFGGIRRELGFVKSAALIGALFGLFHMSAFAFLPIFLLGFFLCYLYEASGSLVPSITAHVLHNTIMVSLTLGFRSLAGS